MQGAEKEKRLPRKQEAGRVEGTSVGGGKDLKSPGHHSSVPNKGHARELLGASIA